MSKRVKRCAQFHKSNRGHYLVMKHSNQGHFFWITGLAGAGKTTVAEQLNRCLNELGMSTCWLDGDQIRNILGLSTQGYAPSEREALAMIYCKLSKHLVDQGLNVIISTISLFHSCHKWNRTHFDNYFEIYIKAKLQTLKNRDQKKLYSEKTSPIVGIDLDYEAPLNPDLIIQAEESIEKNTALVLASVEEYLGCQTK